MRMWMINPKLLCDKHLLGEHGEMHKFIPTFRKGYRVDKRFDPVVQIQFKGYHERHEALAMEMLARGMNHKSPLPELPDFKAIYPQYFEKTVDISNSTEDLVMRCERCKERICQDEKVKATN